MSDELKLFIPITKVDAQKRLVYGVVTEEALDKSGEVFDYDSSKPFYEKWSGEFSDATGGKSVGNLRAMHTDKVAGKLTQLHFDDQAKRISCAAKVIDDAEWALVLEGAYTGFSQGGRYKRRWEDAHGVQRYTVEPYEVSLVDNPCLPSARFELVKADGTTEAKEFKHAENAAAPAEKPDKPNTPAPDEHAEEPNTDQIAASETKPEQAPASPPEPTSEAESEKAHTDYERRAAALGLDQSADAIRARELRVIGRAIHS